MRTDAPPDIRRLAWTDGPAGAMLWDAARLGGLDAASGQALFDHLSYGERAAPVRAGGRNAAWLVSGAGWDGVLRGYRRGGLVARLSRDAYVWRGEDGTRSFREFRLLAMLRQAGLRVPVPLAAAYWRHGAVYRAAILVERIPGARPLAGALDETPVGEVAGAIVQMHRAGVWHADLNAYNILLDDQRRAWIIDFDRGTAGRLSKRARQGNLLRLRRSLRKVAGDEGEIFWRRLHSAYRDIWAAGR